MFHIRVLFSLFLISLQLGTVSPATLNTSGFLLSASATDLFPGKLLTINRFLDAAYLPPGSVTPSNGDPQPSPVLSTVPTKTPSSGTSHASAKPTPTLTPTPTPKPAAPTPLPLGTTQAESAGNLTFDYPEAAPVNTDTLTYTLLVNKEYTLSSKYIPFMVEPNVEIYHKGTNERRYLQPVAAAALEEMFAAAQKDGLKLVLRCGFRSYTLQRAIYAYALKTYGYYETARFHALPGTSEHQTGLAVDLCCKATNYENNYDFLKTKEYSWMLKNAHKYGWILRYPQNKETITGYNFEPWHFRYVGVELATYLKELDITLEEYYGAPSTTYLQGVPKEFWSYMSKTEYEYMQKSVEAYAADPSGKTQPTPSPKPGSKPKVTPAATPDLTISPEPTVMPEQEDEPEPTAMPEPEGTQEPSTSLQPTATPDLTAAPEPAATPGMTTPELADIPDFAEPQNPTDDSPVPPEQSLSPMTALPPETKPEPADALPITDMPD